MASINFWQKWLFIYGIFLSAFGLTLTFFSDSALMDLIFNHQIDPLFWGKGGLEKNMINFRGWSYGVSGSVVAGWGICIAFIAHYPFKEKQKWAWNSIFAGSLVWFIPDTIISIKFGVLYNVFFNIIVMTSLLLPVVFTYHHFHNHNNG